jgi:hypothetical protein
MPATDPPLRTAPHGAGPNGCAECEVDFPSPEALGRHRKVAHFLGADVEADEYRALLERPHPREGAGRRERPGVPE